MNARICVFFVVAKSGIPPQECVDVASHIVSSCSHLCLAGLMTIGSPEHSQTRPNPDFQALVACKARIEAALPLQLELSMGMSDDFEHAVACGSTNVRVGSSIFGSRS
jgi:uncharacterized pyridoxal phosphate-containing UPF0001 family protein